VPDTLDDRVINYKINTPTDKQENWNLCLNSGKAIGCRIATVSLEDVLIGKQEALLKIMWEIIKVP
jgi:plastin-1